LFGHLDLVLDIYLLVMQQLDSQMFDLINLNILFNILLY
jgi:hypothetical protein